MNVQMVHRWLKDPTYVHDEPSSCGPAVSNDWTVLVAVQYIIQQNSRVTLEWIFQHLPPNTEANRATVERIFPMNISIGRWKFVCLYHQRWDLGTPYNTWDQTAKQSLENSRRKHSQRNRDEIVVRKSDGNQVLR